MNGIEVFALKLASHIAFTEILKSRIEDPLDDLLERDLSRCTAHLLTQ